MPKSKTKKRKIAHQQQQPYNKSNPNREFTHEEIWDDSALLRSWDDAVAEYEFYHSIHAKGEDVDEVLARYAAENGDDEDEEGEIGEEGELIDEEIEVDREGANLVNRVAVENQVSETMPIDTADGYTTNIPDPAVASLPQTNDATQSRTQQSSQTETTGADQALENIKMAYYWAGYYSGLYDGQRQTQVQAPSQPQAHNARLPSTLEQAAAAAKNPCYHSRERGG